MHNDVLRVEEINPNFYAATEIKSTKSCLIFFKYLFHFFTEKRSWRLVLGVSCQNYGLFEGIGNSGKGIAASILFPPTKNGMKSQLPPSPT